MGYRPTISAPNGFCIELGKFYGYIDLDAVMYKKKVR